MTLIMEERLYGVYQSMFQADLASTVRHSCIVNGAFRDWCAALAAAARGSRARAAVAGGTGGGALGRVADQLNQTMLMA